MPLAPLPDETVAATLDSADGTSTLHLTNRRVIYTGDQKFLFVIPGDEELRVSSLVDVDYAATVTKRLPGWTLVLGVVLALSGIYSLADSAGAGLLLILVGAGLVVLWWLFKRHVLTIGVSGTDRFELALSSWQRAASDAAVEEFMSALGRLQALARVQS